LLPTAEYDVNALVTLATTRSPSGLTDLAEENLGSRVDRILTRLQGSSLHPGRRRPPLGGWSPIGLCRGLPGLHRPGFGCHHRIVLGSLVQDKKHPAVDHRIDVLIRETYGSAGAPHR